MKLVVNSEGVYLTKVGECFCVKKDKNKQEIAAKKVEQILITTAAALSTDAIELAVENNIDIVFLKKYGAPFGRVWHSKMGSINTIRKKQLDLETNKMGTTLVKEFLCQKMNNQVDFLNYLAMNRRDERKDNIKETTSKIKELIKKVDYIDNNTNIKDIRNSLQGYEGTASRLYFAKLSELMPETFKFKGRSKNPAQDEFNCMLNYGYGIMYSNVERACILAGLDPFIGIMHVDNYNRQAFVFDLIEMYRIYIDQIVFKLFTTKKIKKDYFDKVEGGLYLNKSGKEVLIGKYNEEMEKKITYKGRKIELQNIIQYDCHNIANRILKEAE
ncbi:CRISPR-associated endonuclease Cas1 [Terrisporobacter mayombei]|uniref:CRISPR-associated endonuclease Cas1 n=1 Tax=Terrisporobacter mayombei TaxID=1541 RepID=A0ABY9PWN5_9FIRM|nr:CRISPR-associated endonuclease Cas1 [Terrisporobacter mayombei]MCC3867943.1 CRISPR-associated endonuclease Cas1 [Terrisporobacter mayombei]WMT80077.1 CRISPR-associated endonuclease Cas1 1 [Terrisporobacter mayombei]